MQPPQDDDSEETFAPHFSARIGVVIINFRTPALVKDCLASMRGQLVDADARVIVVDNASGDGSADEIASYLAEGDEDWKRRVALVRSKANTGFSGGNNIGMRCLDAEFYLLVNSDTLMRDGALAAFLAAAARHPKAGAIGPRLEDPDGTPQTSLFRFASPLSEFLNGAQTSALDWLFKWAQVRRAPPDRPVEADWVSFACVMLRREAIDAAGLMDEGFFMYFEDADYCRMLKKAGWSTVYDPAPRVVHLRGGSSPVKSQMQAKKRPPAYYYASRTRYFRKSFGPFGPYAANAAWLLGRGVASLRLIAGKRAPQLCEKQLRDMWTNWRSPLGDRRAPQ